MRVVTKESIEEERNVIKYFFNMSMVEEWGCAVKYDNMVMDIIVQVMREMDKIISEEIFNLYLGERTIYQDKSIEKVIFIMSIAISQHLIVSSLYTTCHLDDSQVSLYESVMKNCDETGEPSNYLYNKIKKRIDVNGETYVEDTYVNRLLNYLFSENGNRKNKNKVSYDMPKWDVGIFYASLHNATSFCEKSIKRLINEPLFSGVCNVHKNFSQFAEHCFGTYRHNRFVERTGDDRIDKLLEIYEFERYYNINYLENIVPDLVYPISDRVKRNYITGRLLPNTFSRNYLIKNINGFCNQTTENFINDRVEQFLTNLIQVVFPLAEKTFFIYLYDYIRIKKELSEFKEIVLEMKNVLTTFAKEYYNALICDLDIVQKDKDCIFFWDGIDDYFERYKYEDVGSGIETMYKNELILNLHGFDEKRQFANLYSDIVGKLFQIEGGVSKVICGRDLKYKEGEFYKRFDKRFSREYFSVEPSEIERIAVERALKLDK